MSYFEDALQGRTSNGALVPYLSHLCVRKLLRTQKPVQRLIGCGGGEAMVRTAWNWEGNSAGWGWSSSLADDLLVDRHEIACQRLI